MSASSISSFLFCCIHVGADGHVQMCMHGGISCKPLLACNIGDVQSVYAAWDTYQGLHLEVARRHLVLWQGRRETFHKLPRCKFWQVKGLTLSHVEQSFLYMLQIVPSAVTVSNFTAVSAFITISRMTINVAPSAKWHCHKCWWCSCLMNASLAMLSRCAAPYLEHPCLCHCMCCPDCGCFC